jgi:hypothetical protein
VGYGVASPGTEHLRRHAGETSSLVDPLPLLSALPEELTFRSRRPRCPDLPVKVMDVGDETGLCASPLRRKTSVVGAEGLEPPTFAL